MRIAKLDDIRVEPLAKFLCRPNMIESFWYLYINDAKNILEVIDGIKKIKKPKLHYRLTSQGWLYNKENNGYDRFVGYVKGKMIYDPFGCSY